MPQIQQQLEREMQRMELRLTIQLAVHDELAKAQPSIGSLIEDALAA
eukprot:gene5295-7541_t